MIFRLAAHRIMSLMDDMLDRFWLQSLSIEFHWSPFFRDFHMVTSMCRMYSKVAKKISNVFFDVDGKCTFSESSAHSISLVFSKMYFLDSIEMLKQLNEHGIVCSTLKNHVLHQCKFLCCSNGQKKLISTQLNAKLLLQCCIFHTHNYMILD